MAQGTQRIRNYVMFWGLLRRLALVAPHFISEDLDYDFVRWLSPMFVNTAMDCLAKEYFLRRIPTSDSSYMMLARKAVERRDLVAIFALCRKDYRLPSGFLTGDLGSPDNRTSIPLILMAAMSNPPDIGTVKGIMHRNNLWLFDLATWFSREDAFYPIGLTGQYFYLLRSLQSLEWAKVAGSEVERLQKVLQEVGDIREVKRRAGRISKRGLG
ncbi:unnamed protein product [Fusarium equiseti]|uniref:Uncharacterized protein n=1 Tax=Fusarium equiseti TaxID=61235 RepID=A0A8J2IX64_FUSEQ|nr:unnamed protein product [Fusarium equiseti]